MSTAASSLTLVWMALVAFAAACSPDPTKLSNSTAAAVLQDAWREEVKLFSLGPLQFRRGNSTGSGYTMLSRYPLYRAMADEGLLKLEDERDLSGGFSGWNDFFALTQAGVQRTAVVSLTPEGTKLGTAHGNKGNEFVTFAVGRYKIERVASNEAMDLNGDKYRVVQGTHVFDMRVEFKDVLAASGEPTYSEWRFRALLKYDPCESKWKLQVADVGQREADFQSQNVPTILAQLRLTGLR